MLKSNPSGNLKPSDADIQLTHRVKSAGEFMDLPVIDHLIPINQSYFSFADEVY